MDTAETARGAAEVQDKTAKAASFADRDLRLKLRHLAFERLDYEVFSLLQSSAEKPRLDNQDFRVLAAVLREGRKQLGGLLEPGKWEQQLDQLVDTVSGIVRGFEVPAKAVNTPPFREFFIAAIDWYVALYTTRQAQRFEPVILALSRLDMAAVPDLRERLAAELADIGRRRPLPEELERFVLVLGQRPYLLTPIGVLRILAFTLHCRLRETPHHDLTPNWLPCWLYHFGHANLRRNREQILSLRNDAHTRLSRLTRLQDILFGRTGGFKTSLMLLLIKLDYWLFIRVRAAGSKSRIWVPFLCWIARSANGFMRNRPQPGATPARANRSGLRVWDARELRGSRFDVLVSRMQGGFGDVLTMRPGLIEAARQKRRGRMVFATNRDFFPVFSIDDPIDLVDIEKTEIDLRSFGQWVNLSDCPAARVEAAELPRIRSNRIDIFARAMGVRFPLFSRKRLYPIAFDDETRRAATEFVLGHAPTGTRIGIQLRSAETYKDVPAILDVVRGLAANHTVFVFDSRPIQRSADDQFIAVDNQPLRQVLAMLPLMHMLVTPDSSFMHVAGMANIPCLALMGSADGNIRCRPYPSVHFLDARKSIACIPCWRNEGEKCRLGNGYTSLCLNFLTAPLIVAKVEEMIARLNAPAAARG